MNQAIRLMVLGLVLNGLAFLAGCSSRATIDLSVKPPPPLVSIEQVEEIARHAVDTNDGWARQADFFVAKTGHTWTVTAKRFNGVNELNQKIYDPHQERYVVISERGRILGYVRGK